MTVADIRDPRWNAAALLQNPDLYAHYEPFYEAMRQRKPGVMLATYKNPYRKGEAINLIDDGDRFVGYFFPTRTDKGTSFVIPNGFTWSHSMWNTDTKTENGGATAYYRRHVLGQLIFNINPWETQKRVTRWNPLRELRDHTLHEVSDSMVLSTSTVDPEGTGFDGDSGVWKKRARDLASGLFLHVLWCPEIREKSYRSVINLVTQPGETEEESAARLKARLEKIRDYKHDAKGVYGWRDMYGNPTPSHPYVSSCLQQQIDRPPGEGGSVISEMLTYFGVYRDPVFGANTAESDMCAEDLMYGLLPSSLFFQIEPQNFETSHAYTRLLINQVLNRNLHSITPGEPSYRWKLMLGLDEFPAMGKLSMLARYLAFVAGYGIKPVLIWQDIASQLFDTYGQYQSIVSNLHALVFGTTNEPKTAEMMSTLLGKMTVGKYQLSTSLDGSGKSRVTANEQVEGLNFIDASDFLTGGVPEHEGILKLASRKPIPVARLPYYEDMSGFKERVAIWGKMNQEPDRLPLESQYNRQNRARLEREYIDFCRSSSDSLQFDRVSRSHDQVVAQRNRAIEDAVSQLKGEWQAA